MQDEYNSAESSSYLQIFEPFVGMAVAAKFTADNRWYRAEILEICPNRSTVVVYFVDFGNNDSCLFENLRYLRNDFFVNEVALFRCRLYGIKYTDLAKVSIVFVDLLGILNIQFVNI